MTNDLLLGPVLIVEDEPVVRKFLSYYMSKHFLVEAVENGVQAVEWLESRSEPPLAIISDLNMPDMDGYEFLKKIRSNTTYDNTPLITLSGNQSSQDKINCLKMGADDYIVKPFNPEELLLRLNKILSRYNVSKP